MDKSNNDALESCFEKLRLEITNTLLSITENSVQQEAIRNKIYSLLTDLRSSIADKNLKDAHSRFVRDTSTIIEGMRLNSMTERNIKRLCKNDMYKWLDTVTKLLSENKKED